MRQNNTLSILLLFAVLFAVFALKINNVSAYDSLLDFENAAQETSGFDYVGRLDNCFSSGKAIYAWEYQDFNNVAIATVIGANGDDIPTTSVTTGVAAIAAARAYVYSVLISPLSFLGLLALGIEYLHMVELCSNAFIIAPHEYYNLNGRNDVCASRIADNGEKEYYFKSNDDSSPLTWEDVPFFYHCDPQYDPVSGSSIQPGSSSAALIANTWGYMGSGSDFCIGERKQYAEQYKDLVGKAVVGSVSGATRFFSGHTACRESTDSPVTLKAGDIERDGLFLYYAYYRFDTRAGKLQMCIASPYTLLPIRIGCTTVPPPNEEIQTDELIQAYIQDTTCGYFFGGRTDLHSLGEALPEVDYQGRPKQYIKDFLMSDFHGTSTVVGCIKDQLSRMLINPSLSIAGSSTESYFEVVQQRMRGIAFAVLVLYVSVTAIMIMSAPQGPRRGELLMWLLKFALVVHFIFIQSWYVIENGEKRGLYYGLIYGGDSVANTFLNAQAEYNPDDFCNYHLQGGNLIQERKVIPSSVGPGVETTNGYNYLKMSVWDLVDCKVANYLNMGSCQYSPSKMAGVWLTSVAFGSGGLGILLAIIAFLYLFLLLLIIFKFTTIVLMATLVITVLVFVSPITIVCALFKPTAGIFQQWMKALIGYFLYPALLFSFLALIMATFDMIYFGPIDRDTTGGAAPVVEQCEDISSVYCAIVKASGDEDPCKVNMVDKLTEEKTFLGFIKYRSIKLEYVNDILIGMAKSLLFVVIFYYYIGVLDSMISIVMGVHGLSSLASGSINLLNIGASVTRGIGKVAGTGSKAVDKLKNRGGRGGAEK